ncbi:MAG: hypothetical protein ACI8RZ_001256 [Myxococcota bacterium]
MVWRAEEDDERAWVEYATAEGAIEVAPQTDADPGYHRVLVLGHPASTMVNLTPVVQRDGERIEGDEVAVETGVLPAGLSDFEVQVSETGQSEESYWMGMLLKAGELGYDGVPLIINRAGQIVWYRQLDVNASALQLERYLGSNDIVINLLVLDLYDVIPQSMLRFGMDGELTSELSTPGSHHAFAQPEPGIIAFLKEQEQVFEEYDDVIIIGDQIIEVDASGELTEVFNTWGTIDIDLEAATVGDDEIVDWTHGNGLFYWAENDSYLVSFHNLSAVLEVSRATGEILAVIGEPVAEPSFSFTGGQEEAFYQQHHPTITPEGTLMLFDNHTVEQGMSRAVEYELDYSAQTATLIWEDPLDNGYTVGGLGQSLRLLNGNTLINWGVLGELAEVTAEGELVWQVNTPLGETFGGGQLIDDLYEGLQ